MAQSDEFADVMAHLSALAPDQDDVAPPADLALSQLRRRLPAASRPSWRNRLMSRRKFALSSIVTIMLAALLFSFPAVRAAASDFLGLFRVQKFAAISVSPAQLALLEEVASEGLYPGELTFSQEPAPLAQPASLSEVYSLSSIRVRAPGLLAEPDDIQIQSGASGQLVVDLEGARAIMKSVGADPQLLPESLDGATIDVNTSPAVAMHWTRDNVFLVQSNSPVVNYPEDVNPALIGEALLQLLGMAPEEASRLANNIDWTSTLVLPVPQEFASFSEVRIDGTTGLALQEVNGRGATIIWQTDGVLYMIGGEMDVDALLRIANSL